MSTEPVPGDPEARTVGLAELERLPDAEVLDLLLGVCAAPTWARAVLDGRPWTRTGTLLAVSDAAVDALDEAGLAAALAGHPRIGERVAVSAGPGPRPGREQAGMDTATDDVRARIAAGNAAYEERFGHVYLVRAAGRSAVELLAVLESRLGHDVVEEEPVVRGELAQINRLRLGELLDGLGAGEVRT